MANFDIAIEDTLSNEGVFNGKMGYVNDKADSGGETIAGISRKNFPNDDIWRLVDEAKHKPNFPYNLKSTVGIKDAIKNFYRTNFWNKIKGDNIKSQQIANTLIDAAVLGGEVTAIKRAQAIVHLSQTGIVDNTLLTKLNCL